MSMRLPRSRFGPWVSMGVLCALALALVTSPAFGKKPPKPSDPPLVNPALVFSIENDVHVITADGTDFQLVVGGGRVSRRYPAWSPDGSRIGFVEVVQKRLTVLSRDFYVIDKDGSNPTWIATYPGEAGHDWIDEERVLVDGSVGGATDATVFSLVGDDSYKLGVIATLDRSVGTPALTVDLEPGVPGYQGWLCITGGGDLGIVRVSDDADGQLVLDAATFTTLVRDERQNLPRWSHDATQIAFYDRSWADGGRDLAVVDVTLGDQPAFGVPEVIFPGGRYFYRPTWSPDGLWIALLWETGFGDGDLYRIRPDGTDLTNVTDTGGWKLEGNPHWSPAWVNDID